LATTKCVRKAIYLQKALYINKWGRGKVGEEGLENGFRKNGWRKKSGKKGRQNYGSGST